MLRSKNNWIVNAQKILEIKDHNKQSYFVTHSVHNRRPCLLNYSHHIDKAHLLRLIRFVIRSTECYCLSRTSIRQGVNYLFCGNQFFYIEHFILKNIL